MIAHKRTRTGCLCCRARRRKCDGLRPQCSNCSRKKLTCQWGIKASFHPSRHFGLTTSEERALRSIEQSRTLNAEQDSTTTCQIIDDTEETIRSYRSSSDMPLGDMPEDDDGDEDEVHAQSNSEEDANILMTVGATKPTTQFQLDAHHVEERFTAGEAVSPGEQFASFPLTNAQAPLHEQDLAEYQTLGMTDSLGDGIDSRTAEVTVSSGPFTPPFSLGLALSHKTSPLPEPHLPIADEEVVILLRSYLEETSKWCETTDSDKHFSMLSAHELLENNVFKGSALALASRQLSMVGCGGESVALQLYQYTIRLLIQQDPNHIGASILASCTLLCVYEMMVSDVVNWRRHLKGCTGVLTSKGWNGSSNGLIKACFWAFARIDIWAAFVLQKSTLIPTERWVDDESLDRAASLESPDDYCNLMILLFARIINCLAYNETAQKSSRPNELEKLWFRCQEWFKMRPKRASPLYRSGPTSANPFPTLIFASPTAICGNTFYHTGSLLILTEMPSIVQGTQDLVFQPNNSCLFPLDDPLWHAREICGLSISNLDHANWVNHLQPLFIAGQRFCKRRTTAHFSRQEQFQSVSREHISSPPNTSSPYRPLSNVNPGYHRSNHDDKTTEYAAEQITLLRHMLLIQRETGWKTEDRAKDLRRLWGLE